MKGLLSEHVFALPFQILEIGKEQKGDGPSRMTVKGIFHRADERNGNNRIYPMKVLEREVSRLQERIHKGETVFSQADHPTDGQARVSDTAAMLSEVSLNPETKEVVGTATILNTRKGEDLAEIIRAGGKIGISARGFGQTEPGKVNGVEGEVVQEDYKLLTYDFVVGQSTPNAVVTNYTEQARMAYGQGFAGGGEDMTFDIKNATLEDLRQARPDLVAALEKALTDKVESTVAEKVKGQVEAQVAAMEKELSERIRKEIVAETAKAAADAKAKPGEKQEATEKEERKQLDELAKKHGVKIVEGDDEDGKTKSEIDGLRKELNEAKETIGTLHEQSTETKTKLEKADVQAHVMKVTKGKKFRLALVEKLQECSSITEVDERLPKEEDFLKRALTEHQKPAGSGDPGQLEEAGAEDGKKPELKETKSGLKLTAEQMDMRRAAGIIDD